MSGRRGLPCSWRTRCGPRTRAACGGSSTTPWRHSSSSGPTSPAPSTRRSTAGTTRRGSGPGCSATTRIARTSSCERSSRATAAPAYRRHRASDSHRRQRGRTRRCELPDATGPLAGRRPRPGGDVPRVCAAVSPGPGPRPRIGTAPAEVTGHPGSRTTSYLQPGRWVTTAELPDAVTTDHWYVIAGLEVVADGAAVVTLGNSITDGRGSGTNRNNRWPDNLARRLQADPRTGHVAVLNAGIGGNTVISGGLGPTALARLDRDVLAQAGARWVILLEGVNDIGGARAPGQAAAVARNLVVAYRDIIDRVHARGLRIYGATIPPVGGV